MKVQRYPFGKTNVSRLKEMRSNIMSPEYAARAEYAKYGALAEGAEAVGKMPQDYLLAKQAEQAQNDSNEAKLNIGNYMTAYKAMVEDAENENWTEDQFRANADALKRTLLDSSSMISENNRGKVEKLYRDTLLNQGILTDSIAMGIRRSGQIKQWNAQKGDAVANKDYVTQEFLDQMALENGWIDQSQFDENARIREGEVKVDNLLMEYQGLEGEQSIADFMAKIPSLDLTEDEQRTLVGEIDFFNKTQKAQQAILDAQNQKVLDRAFVNIRESILYSPIETPEDLQAYAQMYSDENLHAIADEMNLSRADREKLFNNRAARLKQLASRGNKDSGGDIEPDLTSKPYRDSITTDVAAELNVNPETATPEQRDQVVELEVQRAAQYGAIGTTTTNFLNNSATGGARGDEGGWTQFLEALPIYERLSSMDNVVWDGVDSKNVAMYETVRYMNVEQNPDLARKVWVNFQSASPQELDRAKAQYNFDDLMEEINSREDVAGAAGLVRPDVFLWFNEEVEIPGATRSMLNTIGETLAIHEALTNGTVNYRQLSEKVANVMGTVVTASTLNKGVPVGDDGMKRVGSEAMVFAPVKPEAETWAREVLKQDLLGVDGTEEYKVKAFNQIMTIVPEMEFGKEVEMRDQTDPYGGSLADTMPDPFAGIEDGMIPVNLIRVVTPPLKQNQFNDKGERIWHLYYRGKPLLNPDNTFIEWSPHFDPETKVARMMDENAAE